MGKCISKINKDHFFTFEENMKNDILSSKGKRRRTLEMGRVAHSIRKFSEIMTLSPLETGVWWREL